MLTPSEIGTLLRTAKRLEQESDRWDSDVMALKAIARRVQTLAPARPRLMASNALTRAR